MAWPPRLLLATAAALAAAAPAAAVTPAPPPPLEVAIVWHQHQPRYPTVPGTTTFALPWVRLHAAKDYVDMAAMVREFPGLKLTINLTPVLLEQLEAYAHGATDRHAQLALRAGQGLTAAERDEARDRFFQVSGPMLARWPRLAELKALPVARWTPQDDRDAATLFHLAWTDPDALAGPALAGIAAKGRGYTAADTRAVLAEHGRLVREVVPLHRSLQEEGRIEVATTPYYHPILPLIHDTELAREAMPTAPLPARRYHRPVDALWHVDEAVKAYQRLFGRAPRGMWPGEGSVAQVVGPYFRAGGVRWIATDEDVLARSLDTKLRDGEAVTAAGGERLYRAWQTTDGIAVFFRDRKLSDDIGFRYAQMRGEAAAKDLLGQLTAIARRPGAPGRLVTIVLDGENAWENYPDDGKAFLRALYRGLTSSPRLKTVTPSEHLAAHRPRPLPRLWAGSWIGASFATWIGEDEENRAWDLLAEAREAVAAYGKRHGERHPAHQRAMAKIHAAEGSDWFWWYGQDQDSGRDHEFDAAYRGLLAAAYRELGEAPPPALALPIVQVGQAPAKPPKAYLAPRCDGPMDRTEWKDAGAVFDEGGAMAAGGRPIEAMFYGWDQQHLYLAAQHAGGEARPLTIHLGTPAGGAPMPGVPFGVARSVHVGPTGPATLTHPTAPGPAIPLRGGQGAGSSEVAIPWSLLGVRAGDPVQVQLRQGAAAFPARPLALRVPMLPLPPLVTLADGPDAPAWTLPTGGAYTREAVDLQRLEVADDGDAWAFTWTLGAVRDPWGSPIGLSLVSLDLYLAPGLDVEARLPRPVPLLDGRDARAVRRWTHAVNVEGWQQGVYGPGGEKRAEAQAAVDPLAGQVRARVPKAALPADPAQWAYLATLAGQDGFAAGRIRRVGPQATADRFGGRAGTNLLDSIPGPEAEPGLLPYALPAR